MRRVSTFPESRVVEIWQNCLQGRTDLVTEEGVPIRVIYPGRINDDRGADLLDAVIMTDRGLMRGDVEVHVKSSSWKAHRHHLDPVYNRVILHVVFWHDIQMSINLQNGQKVPTLALYKFVKQKERPTHSACSSARWSSPCHNMINRWNTDSIGDILDLAGEERFLTRVDSFQANLTRTNASQSLYQGIMEALGYTKNKYPLRELARRMPLRSLKSLNSVKTSDAEYLARQQALLMGTAGLLPSQRPNRYGVYKQDEDWINWLEEMWIASRRAAKMSEDDWHMFKVRPNNFPVRRIAAMSHLLLRYRYRGILKDLLNKLYEVPVDTGCHELEQALQVITNGYWANHLDFGLPSRISLPALLGEGRAADIVVNILLPFAVAWGRLTDRPELVIKGLDLYRHYPRLAPNTIERHMRNQLGISSYLVSSAQQQQGLLHFYKTLCSQGQCRNCPMGRKVTDWHTPHQQVLSLLP